MSLLLSLFGFFAIATVASSTSSIREKYLDELYREQYYHTLHNIQHHPESCPEFHNSAMYFAITGQRQQSNRVTQTCRHITSVTPLSIPKPQPQSQPQAHYSILLDITLMDIFIFFKEFVCYTFEYEMLLMSVILASCSTLFLIILVFYQY